MKQKKRYESPVSEELVLKTHGILCESQDYTYTVRGQQSNYSYYGDDE